MNKHQKKYYSRLNIDTTKGALDYDDKVIIVTDLISNINLDNTNIIDKIDSLPKDYLSGRDFARLIKNTLFKGKNVTQYAYWESRGWDEKTIKENISKQQKERSVTSISHYTKKGISEDKAKQQISKYQSELATAYHKSIDDKTRRENSCWCIEYYLNRGYSEEYGRSEISRLAKNNGSWKYRPPHTRNTKIEYYLYKGLSFEDAKNALRQRQSTRTVSREQKTAYRIYVREVTYHTNQNMKYVEEVENRSSDLHIDHIVSKKTGFMNDIPPEILGHYVNLRMMDSTSNIKKSARSDMEIGELYERYRLAIQNN